MSSSHALHSFSTPSKKPFARNMPCALKVVFLLFTLINFCDTQLSTRTTHASSIEITPPDIVINSTSVTSFLCVNHQSSASELEASLSTTVPSSQMKISTFILNQTTIQIRLEAKNYVGYFRLFCYGKGQRSKGIYADVTVTAAPGVLVLEKRCEVHEKQYIQCKIRAPTIATAIKNGYEPRFEFEEDHYGLDSTAYHRRHEFLMNESTNEILVFKWKPTVEGEFPNDVRMNMRQRLRSFEPTSYNFPMTPVFLVKPKFILKDVSASKIQINLTAVSPPAYCQRSITPSLTATFNRTWTIIEPERKSMTVDNLASDTVYRVCFKCRRVYKDPDGHEECQEVKTKRSSTFGLIITVSSVITVSIILAVIVVVSIKKWRSRYQPIPTKIQNISRTVVPNRYELDRASDAGSNASLQSNENALLRMSSQSSDGNGTNNYLPIASIDECDGACFPKVLNSSEP